MRLVTGGISATLLAAALCAAGVATAQAPSANGQPITSASPTSIATEPNAGAAPPTVTAPAATSSAPATAAPAAKPAATKETPRFYAPTPGIGQPTDSIGLQPQFTPIGLQARHFHDAILLPLIAAVSVLVLVLLLWVMVRFNRRSNPVPSRTSHNTVIEVIWTVAPVLVLLGIAVPSIQLLAAQYDTPKPDLTVKVIGHQWYWSYQYPDNGDFEVVSNIQTDAQDRARGEPRQLGVDERMVVPQDAVVKIITTSDDVIHSFAVPAFWTKMDAVPGRLNETWFKVHRPGVYYGQCSELCGARHAFMPIAVEVVTRPQFAQWVAAKGGTIKGGSGKGAKPASPDATANSPISNTGPATANPGTLGGAIEKAPTEAATVAATPDAARATTN